MAQCQICAKRRASGNNVSHSNRHTKRSFRPNIQKTRVMVSGSYVRMTVCTRCLRTLDRQTSA